jgi:hypothetical protein
MAHSPIKSRPARSGAVTTSPVWPTNLSEGTCLGPCGFGSDQPGTPPFRFSQSGGLTAKSLGEGIDAAYVESGHGMLNHPGS